jgi:hypothetical protein
VNLETQEVDFFSEITNSNIVRARKRALSGQQTQVDSLTRITKQRQTVLKKSATCFAATALTVTMEKSLTSAH